MGRWKGRLLWVIAALVCMAALASVILSTDPTQTVIELEWDGAAAASADDTLYYLGDDGAYAVEVSSGKLEWKVEPSVSELYRPIREGGALVTAQHVIWVVRKHADGAKIVMALDREAGEVGWTFEPEGIAGIGREGLGLDPHPILYEKHLYVYGRTDAEGDGVEGVSPGEIYVLDFATGKLVRTVSAPTPLPSYELRKAKRMHLAGRSLVMLGDRPETGHDEQCGTGEPHRHLRAIKAISIDTGEVNWSVRVLADEPLHLAADDGGVYVGTPNQHVLEYDPKTGEERAGYNVDREVTSLQLTVEHLIVESPYFQPRVRGLETGGVKGKMLRVFERRSGKELWSLDYRAKNIPNHPPAKWEPIIVGRRVLMVEPIFERSRIHVFDLESGEELGAFEEDKQAVDAATRIGDYLLYRHSGGWSVREVPDFF